MYYKYLLPRKVTYYLAQLKEPSTPVETSRDHRAYKWVDFKEACELVGCSEFAKLLEEYRQFIDLHVLSNIKDHKK